jgi:uncharacterized protein YheU (UPF0270 family)
MDPNPDSPIVLPHTELSPEALRGVVESFILREGTDYGERELSLEEKVANVMRQLEQREVRIVFDPETASVTIERCVTSPLAGEVARPRG